jgi:peptidyl-prolyl cis-trans isomerase C
LITWATLAAVGCGGGCGGGSDKKDRQPPPRVSLDTAPAGRTVIAEVEGVPVYEDCLALQMSKPDMTREAAADECIDFELLAREAERRGFASDPAVLEARKKETVRVFIDQEFWSKFDSYEDVPEHDLRRAWKMVRYKYDHPEYRFTVYVRAPVPGRRRKHQTRASWKKEDAAAKALADELYARLSKERKLTKDQFFKIAYAMRGDRKLVHDANVFNFPKRGRAVPAFADAAFAIPEAGMVSKPARTKWGWDIILLISILPEVHMSFEEAKESIAKEIFEASQRLAFLKWSSQFASRHDIFPNPKDPDQMAVVEAHLRSLEGPGLPVLPGEPNPKRGTR